MFALHFLTGNYRGHANQLSGINLQCLVPFSFLKPKLDQLLVFPHIADRKNEPQ